jgi:ketosteroid isomerase-like protein
MDFSLAVSGQCFGGACPVPSLQAKNDMPLSNKAAVKAMLEAWMAGDSSAFPSLLSDDIEWTVPGSSLVAGTTRGLEELAAIATPFGARFSHSSDRFRPRRINGVYANGDVVIAHFDAAGTANDGKPYSNSYVWLLTMSNGKIVRATAFFDSIAFDDFWRRVQPA